MFGVPIGVNETVYKLAEKLIIDSGGGPRDNDAAFADWRDVHTQDLSLKLQKVYDEYEAEHLD